jgi:hypothetical protein
VEERDAGIPALVPGFPGINAGPLIDSLSVKMNA